MTKGNFKNMRWIIIGLCFLANAINYIDRANLAIAAPHIRAELALDPATMGVIMSAFFWTYALCQMPAGWFIDKVGVRLSLAFAVAWWSVFTAVTGMVHTFGHMVGSRLLLGVGESAAMPSFAKAAYNWFPRKERGIACSIFDSGSRVGSALSLPLIAWIISVMGWRGSFIPALPFVHSSIISISAWPFLPCLMQAYPLLALIRGLLSVKLRLRLSMWLLSAGL